MFKYSGKHIASRLILLSFFTLFSLIARFNIPCSSGWCRSNMGHVFRRVLPANFGKTHFTLGLSKEDTQKATYAQTAYAQDITPDAARSDCGADKVYFSPEDDLQKMLISYIDGEKKGINLAIFSFTDREIAQALVRAQERGVSIKIVADPGFLHDRFSKISWLFEQGIPVFVYDPKRSSQNTLSNVMHNKFVIFESNVDDRALVWTGSFNFTKSARLSNQENVVVLCAHALVQKYKNKFTQLKDNAIVHEDKRQPVDVTRIDKK